MPKVKANNITMNYDQQGTGEPLILIPYLAADHACYAFQVAEYAKHFTCISLDLRGTGETDKPEGVYSTELLADDVAAFMQATGIQKAHISGLSLGAATGMWVAAKYPDKVQSLSLHSGWPKTDPFIKTVIEGFQVVAKAFSLTLPENSDAKHGLSRPEIFRPKEFLSFRLVSVSNQLSLIEKAVATQICWIGRHPSP
jgi:pimeloyl-ACP methyl ester carboxylesterase